jgi:hypothetical protein
MGPQAERAWRSAGVPATQKWSGRRGSNPRPTAWKAVTLPLSYSRLFEPLPLTAARNLKLRSPHFEVRSFLKLVAREGFEPSKPLGRQIYSLLRLTASLPRQILIPGLQPQTPYALSLALRRLARFAWLVRYRSSSAPSCVASPLASNGWLTQIRGRKPCL